MRNEEIQRKVEQLAGPVAASAGLEIVDVQYRRESRGNVLRILLDQPGGVTVEDCASFSRELSDLLDFEDPIPASYHLEVSSPGLDRPLARPRDFVRFAGSEITLRTCLPVGGQRNFQGVLRGMDGERIMLETNGRTLALEWSWVKKANLVPAPGAIQASAGHRTKKQE